ncbi:unnamed protein product [Musa acuminata subsp. malaccensis]|uniref:(wild Malaysian banana) hypothetical protein n=1 Tax=Musa acuminata subsp. malaccensis TaxID=214687 RepID=A0A804IX61_MUSAM|nr:unnamed protein product [Musa acuminata subsp. malaccensis]
MTQNEHRFSPGRKGGPRYYYKLSCERECSRGEDYRLIKLSIIEYARRKEKVIVVECRGHDCARFQNVDHAHG